MCPSTHLARSWGLPDMAPAGVGMHPFGTAEPRKTIAGIDPLGNAQPHVAEAPFVRPPRRGSKAMHNAPASPIANMTAKAAS